MENNDVQTRERSETEEEYHNRHAECHLTGLEDKEDTTYENQTHITVSDNKKSISNYKAKVFQNLSDSDVEDMAHKAMLQINGVQDEEQLLKEQMES